MHTFTEEQLALWPPTRIAAIDIGSNSVRLEIAQVEGAGGYRVLDEERESTRLAGELDHTGRLADEAVRHTLETLRRFKSITDGFGVQHLRTIATSAVREAANGQEFCQRVAHEVGLEVQVIQPREEGRLAFLSVARSFDISGRQVAVMDIGGGSTEIVLASSGHVDAVYATRLGAVRLTEQFGLDEAASARTLKKATDYVDRRLKKHIGKPPFVPTAIYGSGGTFTAMAAVLAGRAGDKEPTLRGYVVKRADVRHLLADLAAMPLEKRRKVPGLSPTRADIIVAGLLVIERAMRRLHVNTVTVHTRGVRDGLLLTMIQEAPERAISGEERAAAVEAFARSCGVDIPHAQQVARIAGLLVEQLSDPLGIDPDDRPLIEAAALLANVGYLINYEAHHKHSYHLIVNSELSGFERREVLLLANVARYHRGAAPKQKHKGFAALSPQDQTRVKHMAAILRLALALDRTHRQSVEDVACRVDSGKVEIAVRSRGDAEVDLWSARRKVALFEKAFGRQVVFTEVEVRTDAPGEHAPPRELETARAGSGVFH